MSFPQEKKRLHIELTGKCNLSCIYCFQSDWNNSEKTKNELTTNQIKGLIEQSKKIGCKTVTITGGEPFMRKDIFEVIDYCEDLEVEILTNSILIDKKTIKIIGEKYPQVKTIKISIDGLDGHDINRKPSQYKQIISNMKLFRKLTKVNLIANTVITKHSIDDLHELYKVLKEIPVDIWRIDLPFLSGRYINSEKNAAPKPEKVVEKIKEILLDYFNDKKPFEVEIFNIYKSGMACQELFSFDTNIHPCAYSSWRTLCIKPNGDVTFCPSLLMKLSSIIDEKGKVNVEKAIVEASKKDFFSIKIKEIEKCCSCKYLKICGSGCRADALYWEKEILAPDPVACTYMNLMEKSILPILPYREKKYLESLIENE